MQTTNAKPATTPDPVTRALPNVRGVGPLTGNMLLQFTKKPCNARAPQTQAALAAAQALAAAGNGQFTVAALHTAVALCNPPDPTWLRHALRNGWVQVVQATPAAKPTK